MSSCVFFGVNSSIQSRFFGCFCVTPVTLHSEESDRGHTIQGALTCNICVEPTHLYLSLKIVYSADKKPCNRPLPSSKNPHFQNEARCTTCLVKMSFISMRMKNGPLFICKPTGSPSSKYERQRASALLHNILNIRICMEKNLSFLKPTKTKGFQ